MWIRTASGGPLHWPRTWGWGSARHGVTMIQNSLPDYAQYCSTSLRSTTLMAWLYLLWLSLPNTFQLLVDGSHSNISSRCPCWLPVCLYPPDKCNQVIFTVFLTPIIISPAMISLFPSVTALCPYLDEGSDLAVVHWDSPVTRSSVLVRKETSLPL